MKKWKQVSRKEFDTTQQLREIGSLTQTQIASITGRPAGTVSKMLSVRTWEEYEGLKAKQTAANNAKRHPEMFITSKIAEDVAVEDELTLPAVLSDLGDTMLELARAWGEPVNSLRTIADSLETIADKAERKSIFKR